MNLGLKVRTIRKQRGKSMQELADAIGCSQSFISQIERNVTNPSISTLQSIAKSLNTPFVDFFESKETYLEERVVLKKKDLRNLKSLKEKTKVYSLILNNNPKDIDILKIDIEPGGKSDLLYLNNSREIGYIVKGTLNIYLGEEVYEVSEGDSIHFSGDIKHGWENKTNSIVETIWFITPSIIQCLY